MSQWNSWDRSTWYMGALPTRALALPSNASLLHQPATSLCFLDHHLALISLSLFSYFSVLTLGLSLFLSRVLQSPLQSLFQLAAHKAPSISLLSCLCYFKACKSFCSPPIEGPLAPDICALFHHLPHISQCSLKLPCLVLDSTLEKCKQNLLLFVSQQTHQNAMPGSWSFLSPPKPGSRGKSSRMKLMRAGLGMLAV